MTDLSTLHRKLENDQCFDLMCTKDSAWKVIYMTDAGRTETRLCVAHSEELLKTLERPRTLVRLKRD